MAAIIHAQLSAFTVVVVRLVKSDAVYPMFTSANGEIEYLNIYDHVIFFYHSAFRILSLPAETILRNKSTYIIISTGAKWPQVQNSLSNTCIIVLSLTIVP